MVPFARAWGYRGDAATVLYFLQLLSCVKTALPLSIFCEPLFRSFLFVV